MNLIEATKEHIFIIRSLSEHIWPHTFESLLSKEQIKYMMDMMYSQESLEKQMDDGCHYLIAEKDGEYHGYVSYETGYKGSDITKVHKIYILPSTQGSGLGRLFINKVADIAKKNKNTELCLNVNRENAKAIGFYERMGFVVTRSEDNDIGNGFYMIDYVMNKKL